jgi:hypothetical protein
MASVRKQENGRYLVRWWTDRGEPRKRRFKLATEARRFAAEVEVAKAERRYVDPRAGRVRFAKYADEVMAARLNLRPATRARDESYLKNYIVPTFGSAAIARIDKKSVEAWVRSLREERGLAPRTIREAHRILSGILREAVEDGSSLSPRVVGSNCRG